MNVIEALNNRHSCRDFLDKPVPQEVLEKIVSAALCTPFLAELQPWDVYVAGYETSKKIISAVNGILWRGDVPVLK